MEGSSAETRMREGYSLLDTDALGMRYWDDLSGRGLARTGSGCGILLDEVSSGVDRETERVTQGIIRVEFKHYTIMGSSTAHDYGLR
jgi:hypothetical protein